MSIGMVFRKAGGGRLGLDSNALHVLLSFAQVDSGATEAGGVLIGRFIAESEDIVIDMVTGPMAGDRRQRNRFDRAKRAHQQAIDRAWKESDGTRTYLGEWHTHPEPFPSPSAIDLRDWRKRIKRDTFHGDALHFLIVGQKEISAWEMARDRRIPFWRPQPVRLSRTEDGKD